MTERLCEPQIDRVMNLSTEIGLAEMVRVIPDAQTDAALRIWPTTTSKLRLETGWEKCPHGPHGPKHATELLIRTW